MIQVTDWSLKDILQPAQAPGDARQDAGEFGPNLTIVKGTVLGTKTADKKFYAYNDAAVDGLEVAKALSMYSIKTDANGRVFRSDTAAPDYRHGIGGHTSAVWKSGIFDPTELTGWNAAAAVDLHAITLANGFIKIG